MSIPVVIICALGLALSFGLGYVVATLVNHEAPIGDLRIDESDPDDGPYLFLELKSKPDSFKRLSRVVLNVKNENFISQK